MLPSGYLHEKKAILTDRRISSATFFLFGKSPGTRKFFGKLEDFARTAGLRRQGFEVSTLQSFKRIPILTLKP
jgi:hypothetical protein